LASAIACAEVGARVTLLEAKPSRAPTPAHLELVPNLLREVATLGVADACVRQGFPYSGVSLIAENGTPRVEVSTDRLAGDRLPSAVGIAFDDFIAILSSRAAALGVEIETGQCVVDIADSGRVCVAGREPLSASLVVVAAGADTPIARALFGPLHPTAACQRWWHVLIPRPQGLDRPVWLAGTPGRRLILVPVSMSQAGIAVLRDAPGDGDCSAKALIRTLNGWGEVARRLAALVDPDSATVARAGGAALMEGSWCRGAALRVGASARAMDPAFGQSAAQAIEDAVVLGELLRRGLRGAVLSESFIQRRNVRARRVHALVQRAAGWLAHPEPSTNLSALSAELDALVALPP
jgi:2-polyprenyl-6-methoxyphenol hydroxylase-like FAD-dependent oxidoreductase